MSIKSSVEVPEKLKGILGDCSVNVIYFQKSDLTIDRNYGDAYLVLTSSHLIFVSDANILYAFPLNTIKNVSNDELTGGGRVVVNDSSGVYHCIYYTNSMVPYFTDSVDIVNTYIKNGKIPHYEQNYTVRCSACDSPLPDRGVSCPKCIPKLSILKKIIQLTYPYKLQTVLLMICTSMMIFFQVLPPYITKHIVDDVVNGRHMDKLNIFIGAMIGTALLYFVFRLAIMYLTSWISAKIVTDLRHTLYDKLHFLSLRFFTRREPGELVGRIMHDTGDLQHFLVDGLPYLAINVCSFIVIGCILFSMNWQLTLFVLLPVPILLAGSSMFWKKINPLYLKEGTIVGHLHTIVNESLRGLRVIKLCSREKDRIDHFGSVAGRLAGTQMQTMRIAGIFNELLYLVMSIGVTMIWYVASGMITSKNPSFTLGDLLAFVGYIWLFFGPLQWFSVILNWMTHALSGAERIFEILDSAPETHENNNTIRMPEIKGAIEFRNVNFSYERGREVLKNISFTIEQGKLTGLIGQSGAGKSTIINLLGRFYEPDSGSILLDNVPINKIQIGQLRKSLGVVLQEPFMFSATIAENIAYGNDKASMKEIIEAAQYAFAHEFIVRKPEGYDTLIGDGGEKLSGGEMQRIAIARALIQNPPILILDEATSSVDTVTEQQIQTAIATLIKGRTTIAIAHRLSTLRNADRLIVLEKGKIAESGTHTELLAKRGIYSSMVASYSHTHALQSVVW